MKSFIVQQKITPFVNKYAVYEATEGGSTGPLVAFAQQKRLTFKEQILFYADESKSQLAFTVKAENVLDYHGRFLVTAPDGTQLGAVRKNFRASLLRSTWEMLSGDTVVCQLREASLPLALLRRVWGMVPYLGDFPFFLKYHFDLLSPDASEVYGRYAKTTLLRDHYRLDITDEAGLDSVNWQTLAAQCVLLDALQGR